MLSVESNIYIDAPREKVFDLLVHPEKMASEMDSVREVKVLSRDANMIVSETTAAANGRDTVFVLEAYLFPPERLKIHQLKGELRRLEGEDLLRQEGDGTRVTEKLQFDIGIPFFGDMLGKMGIRQAIEEQSRERLEVLKRLAEAE